MSALEYHPNTGSSPSMLIVGNEAITDILEHGSADEKLSGESTHNSTFEREVARLVAKKIETAREAETLPNSEQ